MKNFVLLAVLAFPLAAQIPFEAVVSGVNLIDQCGESGVPLHRSQLEWINPDTIQIDDLQLLDGPDVLASAGGLEVFGLGGRKLSRVTPNGVEVFFELPAGQSGQALAVSSGGRIFVKTQQQATHRLLVVSTAGSLLATHLFPVPGLVSSIEVAPDGCTVFYAQGKTIRRINGCTGTPLADFTVAQDWVYDVVPLAGGQALVVAGYNVLLYDSSGAVVRVVATMSSYANPQDYYPSEIALANDGETLWMTADNGCLSSTRKPALLLRIALDTGQELSRRELSTHSNRSLVLGSHAALIPTANPFVLALIALALGMAGLIALRPH